MNHKIVTTLAIAATMLTAAPTFALSASSTHATSSRMTGVHLRHETHRTLQGTVASVSGTSFTLTVRGTTYTVNTATSTRIVNRRWHKIDLASIVVGNKVRVYGTVSGTTVTAQVIRDISLPTTGNATSTATH